MNLPQNITPSYFNEHYRLQTSEWGEAIREICETHSIHFNDFRTFNTESSNLIASVSDEIVIKVFPQFHRHQWESERRVLQKISSYDIFLPIPRLIAQGERLDNWTYVILSKVPGRALQEIWPSLSFSQKASLLRDIGKVMARMHSIPVGELQDLNPEWSKFLTDQAKGIFDRHSRLQMPEWFLSGAKNLIFESLISLPKQEHVILTGEYTPFNLLIEGGPNSWRLSGMIDFGDAMIGPREYDFLGPCLFLCEGNYFLIENFFDGYGFTSPCKDLELRHRLLLLTVLHRYSNLKLQIRIPGIWDRVQSFGELESAIFPDS